MKISDELQGRKSLLYCSDKGTILFFSIETMIPFEKRIPPTSKNRK